MTKSNTRLEPSACLPLISDEARENEDLIQSLDRAVQSMDRENSKIEKQAKEQTILRRARFLSALTAGSMEDIAHAFSGFVTGIPRNYFS